MRKNVENRFEPELVDGQFKHKTRNTTFRGEKMPSTFNFTVNENDKLREGQQIGTSRTGQTLYWSQGSVISRG